MHRCEVESLQLEGRAECVSDGDCIQLVCISGLRRPLAGTCAESAGCRGRAGELHSHPPRPRWRSFVSGYAPAELHALYFACLCSCRRVYSYAYINFDILCMQLCACNGEMAKISI